MANNKIKINIDADTTEALKQMKEVTEAANECVAALEKLEQVMGKFTRNGDTVGMYSKVSCKLDGKVIAESVIAQTTDSINSTENTS